MYPISEFQAATNLSAEFYRSSRIFRDVLMVCPSLHLGEAVARTVSRPVYHYNFNQTVVDQILDPMYNVSGLRVGHTSEFAYVFDSFHAYEDAGYPINETTSDYDLMQRASRSWSTFFTTGNPALQDHVTLQDWSLAYPSKGGPQIMTIGGPHEGMSLYLPDQKLDERCGFLNNPAIIEALAY
jgi:carboxylesterase type B